MLFVSLYYTYVLAVILGFDLTPLMTPLIQPFSPLARHLYTG